MFKIFKNNSPETYKKIINVKPKISPEVSRWQQKSYRLAHAKLRVNIKSLAAESKFIRREIKRSRDEFVKGCLNNHRINDVRSEARCAQLALAALRNIPYDCIERNAKSQPDWNRVKSKVSKTGYGIYIKQQLEKWIDNAQNSFEVDKV